MRFLDLLVLALCIALSECQNAQDKHSISPPQIYALRYPVSDYPARLVNSRQRSGSVAMGWLAHLVRDSAGDYTLVDGDSPLHTNFSVALVAGHTPGSQVVRYKDANSTFLFTGDECYFRESCEKKIPLPHASAFSVKNNRAFLQAVEKNAIILSGHESNFLSGHWLSDYIFSLPTGR